MHVLNCITPRLTFLVCILLAGHHTLHSQYQISQSGTYQIEISSPTFITVFEDDATEIPIGFSFDFFGTPYTHCWVGSDGFISFGPDPGGGCCGQPIPDNTAPNNLIAVAWTNMDWNYIHYELFGTAPNRRLVITLDYRSPCDSVYYGQVKLYETTHVIEIHTQEWDNGECQGWSSTQGLEDSAGSIAFPVPGRNYNDDWEINLGDNDYVSFTPTTEFVYIVEEDDPDFSLEFNVPNDVTVFEDDFTEVPLDFTFEFFGQPYTSVLVDFNGFLGFTAGSMGCCGAQLIPSAGVPNHLIAAAWTDVATNYSNGLGNYNIYRYGTVGSAPNRVFVAEFDFSDECYNTYYYGQIKLFESDYSIEIHTDSWADGNAPCYETTQGIENGNGTSAYYLDGRNFNTNWSVTCCNGDMVRFLPASSLPQNDAGVAYVLTGPYCTGPQDMRVLIQNFGGAQIDSVTVDWTWDGVPQDSVMYGFPMPVNNSLYAVDLGSKNLVYGQTYELKAWTTLPNGMPDDNTVNDTMVAMVTVGMQDTFTIGGTNPDFATLQEAIDSLAMIGICDTVVMLLRPDTLTGHWVIPSIPGSFGKKVIFTAENGDSTSVVLQYEAIEEDSNYVIMFDNSFDVIVENMTIKALGDYYATAIELRNFSYRNTVRNCAIYGKNTTSTVRDLACIFSRAKNPYSTFADNTIQDGSYGIFHEIIPPGIIIGLQGESSGSRGTGSGDPDDYTEEISITGNTFLNFSKSAIRTVDTKGLQIHQNHMVSNQYNVRAMQLTDDYDTLGITRNSVYIPNGEYALHLSNVDPPAGYRALVSDNMFNVPSTSISAAGVGLFNCDDLDFVHNTVRSNSSYPLIYTFHHSGGTLDSVYNNIFVNTNGGQVIYLGSTTQSHHDYNVYYTTGPTLGALGGSNNTAPDLPGWQTLTGFDLHSLAYDPLFVSDSNLHTTASLINAAGSPLYSTPEDFDGDLRSMTAPDPGADEFMPGPHDAALTAILSPIPVCDPEQDIRLVLVNPGIDSLHEVTIEWTVNSLPQTPVVFPVALGPEGDTAHVTLTPFIFGDEPDTLRFWTTMPNDSLDSQPENDTIQLIYRLPLQGIYTIGGTSPDFGSFTAAANAMKTFTICGPVTFQVRDGLYTEQVLIDSIEGSSSTNTITFESESMDSTAVTLQYLASSSASNYILRLNGTDHITFRYLQFKPLNNFYADMLDARNGVTHLTLEHNYFNGTTTSANSAVSLKTLAFGINEHYSIRNNYFKNGHHAVLFFNGGSSLETYSDSMLFEYNIFENQRSRGIDVQNTQNLTIRRNTITTNTVSSYVAIDIDGSHQRTDLSHNYISTNTVGDGFYLNRINFQDTPGDAYIYNNMIHSAGTGLGLRIWNSSRPQIIYNSIHVTGSGAAVQIAGGDSAVIHNNIFSANTGRAITSYSSSPDVICDYNDLYNLSGDLGYWNSIAYADLSAWQNGTNFDTNSMSIDPEFVSATDLHILADTLDGAGIPVAGILLDFDDNPRNAMHPDIGADEIGANENDAGIFALLPEMPFARGPQDIRAVVRNYGGNVLDTVDIEWTINGVPQPTVPYTGPLASLQQDTVTLGTVDFLLATPYIFSAWTDSPNENPDLYNSNDTTTTVAIYAAVSDTVTIGGAAPDVPSLTAALAALTLGGVLDSVHFQLRNGTYHETLTIPQTMGMNCGTPIVFESESGNAGDVIWDNQDLTSHTLLLEGADGLTFRNLTVRTVIPAYHAIEFRGGANCNTFEHCIIEGVTTTSTSIAQAAVYSSGSVNIQNTIRSNTIRKGSYGIYWHGQGTSTENMVKDNILENAHHMGAQIAAHQAPVVSGNIVTSNSTTSYFYGLYLNECYKDALVEGNQILMNGKRGVGIILYSCTGTSELRSLVANNFIILGQSSSSYGIHQQYGQYSDVQYNTIRLNGGTTSGRAYYRHATSHVHLLNNIFENTAGGYGMYFSGNATALESDYNDLLGNGTYLVHLDGMNYADLTAWQATGHDTNSISEDPMFVTPTSYAITSAALNAVALPSDRVPLDIDGEPRDTLTPDIGCDEFELYNDDVGILSINYPVEPFPSGLNTIFIKFSNNGQDTLVSMQVDWEVDDIPQPTYYWTGLLPSAATYDSLDIGEFNFSPYQYHKIKVWVSEPNGMMDELASNDTLTTDSLYPALQGVYTIGGVDPDFDSLTIAVHHLNEGGASGPVIFNIRSGTYLETLDIDDYPGSDCTRPVLFQSETGDSTDVTITNLGINDNTLTLNGADGVIFQHLTLESVNPAYRNVITYQNGAHCNQFLQNEIRGYEGTSNNNTDAVIRSSTSLDTSNVFQNNRIRFGAYSFYLIGTTTAVSGTRIEGNQLDQPYAFGVYAYQENGIRVLNNSITLATYTAAKGIELNTCHDAIRIMGNHLIVPSGAYGINIFNSNGSANAPGITANNFISIGGNGAAYGLYANNSQNQSVYHNNIQIYSTTSNANVTASLYLTNNTSLSLRNNIIATGSPGPGIYANGNTSLTSDFNDFYISGMTLGTLNGLSYSDLDAWQSGTLLDSSSLEVNPQYMSDTDLHVTNILLNGAGQTLASVTADIDGDARLSPPDIGADEFDPSIPNDAGVFMFLGPHAPFAHGNQPVEIALKNYGADTLSSVSIRWLVNGIEQTLYAWTGMLAPAQCDTLVVGNFNFAEYTDHDLIFWTEGPNGVPDSTHVNDTLQIEDHYPALSGTYTVGGVLPDFNLFGQVETALNKGGILGDVYFNIRDGVYSTQFRIQDFPRNSPTHTVTFRGESGDSSMVTIRKDFYLPSQNYTVRLSHATQIQFEDLTLASTQGRVVDIADGSSHIAFSHCRLTGQPINYVSAQHQVLYSNTTTEDSVTISHCRIENGDYGIFLVSSAGDPESGTLITDNEFHACWYRSIHLHNHTGVIIRNNRIRTTQNNHEAIALTGCSLTKEISGNDIRLTGGGQYGLNLHYVSGTMANPARIFNNYVYITGGTSTTYGIYSSNGQYNDFDYNTVRIGPGQNPSAAFYDYSSQHTHLLNCNLANERGGYSLQNNWYPGTTNTIDYSNLFSTGPVLALYYTAYANLMALQAGTGQNINGMSAEPLFAEEDPDIYQAALDGTATTVSGINTDIYGNARHVSTPDVGAVEFTLLAHDIGAKLLVSPSTYCGLGNMEEVTMRIQNYGANTESSFDVAYRLNGGAWVEENVGVLSVSPGGTLDYTFSVTEDLSSTGTYVFDLRTSLSTDLQHANDTVFAIPVEHIPALTTPVSNMIPPDGQVDLETTVSLSWSPAQYATKYDVYIWPFGQTQPATPQIANITAINTLYGSLSYGTTYHWRVVAKNVCDQMVPGPIQEFSVRQLPNLQVDTVTAPLTAFSGQQIQAEWIVHNLGPGSTQSQVWSDAAFLSTDATLNTSFDTYIGAVQNLTALDSSQSYSHTGTFTIPQGFSGNYYLFIYSDRWNNLPETQNSDNWERTPVPISISLTPSPDLIVLSVTTPTTVFSGESIPVTYTVKNDGLGPVNSSAEWRDRILLGEDPLNAIGTSLLSVQRSFALQPDSTYQYTEMVTLPDAISGTYYIHVTADHQNTVYEYAAEGNNSNGSLPINVILAPPPDLVPDTLIFQDTVSNYQTIPFSWTVINEGAGAVEANYWLDRAFLSLSPVYNPNFLIQLTQSYQNGTITPMTSYTSSPGALIPGQISGSYFVYLHSDISNHVFEHTYDGNNVLKSPKKIFIAHADLEPVNLVATDTVVAGTYTNVQWKNTNNGPGQVINRNIRYRVWLSPVDSITSASELIWTSPHLLTNMMPGDTVMRLTNPQIPSDAIGSMYLVVQEDTDNVIYEGNEEQNNTEATPIYIEAGPTPDIVTLNINTPDTITAATIASLTYALTNDGTITANLAWQDKIYYSFDSIWNPNYATLLVNANQPSGLQPDTIRTMNVPVLLPASTVENVYYFYVVSDAGGQIYEGPSGEMNNILRSDAVYVKSAPLVDLALLDMDLNQGSPLGSGQTYQMSWTVQNQGEGQTITENWLDAFYLSSDTLFQMASDDLIGELNSTGPQLSPSGERVSQSSLTMPNGISGNYYIIGVTDVQEVHEDTSRANNINLIRDMVGDPVLFTINLSPSPDLIPDLFNTPATGIAGQPIQAIYHIDNAGNAPATSWLDKVYLSTDNTINYQDVLLWSSPHGPLPHGQTYSDTVDLFLPANYFGNYILLFQTDANNQLYEHNGEGNNILPRSIQIINPPPSDLVTEQIVFPLEVIAGENIEIHWTTMNIGANPASGVFREVVYISPDTTWSTDDAVFGYVDENIYLAPGGSNNQSLVENIVGVSTGDYHAIVQTDARQNFNESNEDNNFTYSEDLMHIDVRQLYLDSLTLDTLDNHLELYYKIEVGPELDGETILLQLEGDSLFGHNELYVKYNQMPTRADFDIGFDRPFAPDQELFIPDVEPGTYYILVFGFSTDTIIQPVTLFAKVIDYEILSVTPNKGVTNTQVTLQVRGAKLQNTLEWRLRQSNPWFVLPAASAFTVNDNLAYVTFDLTGVAVDTYALDFIKADSSLAFVDDFMVVADGGQPQLQIGAQLPGGVPGRPVPVQMVISFINNGDVDVINPAVRIEAPYGNLIANTLEEIQDGIGSPILIVPLVEDNGPPGVIRPGASGRIEVYGLSAPNAVFGIRLND